MALIYDSSVAGSKSSYIYAELLEQGMEIDGDRVLISLPMTRINEAQLKVVVSAGCGIESAWLVRHKPLLGAVIDASNHKPSNCIIYVRPQAEATMIEGRDLDWGSAVAQAKAADCVPVEASDPLDILCTSGTTGRPNDMVRDNGGHAVAMTWFMRYIYNVRLRDVCWTAIVVCRLIVCQ